MGVVVDGFDYEVPGLPVVSYLQDPSIELKLGEDGRRRRSKTEVRWIVLHTTRGKRRKTILPGLAPPGPLAENNARYWRRSPKSAGAHLVVDQDATALCTADGLLVTAYGAPGRNGDAFHIEVAGGYDREDDDIEVLYDGQLEAAADLAWWSAIALGVEWQTQWPHVGPVPFLMGDTGAESGVICHFNCDPNRGPGDCGPELIQKLLARGCKPRDFRKVTR
jgi:hypothetical protein